MATCVCVHVRGREMKGVALCVHICMCAVLHTNMTANFKYAFVSSPFNVLKHNSAVIN